MDLMNRMLSYDKNKNVNQKCDCEECINIEVENQTVEYPLLSDEEIEKIIEERYSDKDKKTKTFIRKALRKHGDRYDYSNVVYIKAKIDVEIICRVEGHKPFPQTPNNHLSGKGCKICGNKKIANKLKISKEEFIERARKVHGDKYDYSKVKYKDMDTKVIIVCSIHDDFPQKPSNHLQGNGCKLCGIKKQANELKMSKEFIKRANKIHGIKRYDYSKVEYVGMKTEVIIICPKHGPFPQTPSNHLQGKGCRSCQYEKLANDRKLTLEEFIEKARKIHGDKYDYSKVNYIDSKTDVIIICKEHGDFKLTPNNHLKEEGCKKCNKNIGENSVRKFLTEKGIEFEEQKTFDGCKNKRLLKFDFYLPKYNLCIESDGNVHSEKINWNGKMTDAQMEENLKSNQHRDDIKNEYCEKNNITLLRVNNLRAVKELTKYFQNNGIIKE